MKSRDEVEGLREGFFVLDVRGDLQAVDLDDAERKLDAGDLFFEGNPFVGRKLLEVFATKVTVLSIFLSPATPESSADFWREEFETVCWDSFV